MKIIKNKTIHITDFLDIQLKNFEGIPTKLYITLEDLADLKEYLGLNFLDELGYKNLISLEQVLKLFFKTS